MSGAPAHEHYLVRGGADQADRDTYVCSCHFRVSTERLMHGDLPPGTYKVASEDREQSTEQR